MAHGEIGSALLDAGISPPSPGQFFQRRILSAKGHDLATAAYEMDMSVHELEAIVSANVAIDPWLAARMAAYAGVSAQFWLNMQAAYNLGIERANRPRPGSASY